MPTRRLKPWAIIVACLLMLALGVMLYRQWQGPVLPGYQVSAAPLVQNVVATGRVVSNSRAQVGSEITGVVTERLVREGDKVAGGDALLTLRADDLAARVREARAALAQLRQSRRPQAQARLRQAEAQLAQARREAGRSQALLQIDAISREAKEQADQALASALASAEQARFDSAALSAGQSEEGILQERLAAAEAAQVKTRVRTQFSGTVLTRNVEVGDLVQPGRVLFEIARADSTEVLVPVDERNLGVLALGQAATCVPDAYPDRQFKAVISFIAPAIDPQRGTVDIRLRVEPLPDYLRDDLTVTANIETGRRERALAVPNDALFELQGSQASAFVVRQGKARRATLTLGLRGLAMTEVSAGLEEGDWVLIRKDVREGQRVRVVRSAAPLQQARQSNRATRNETPIKFN
ncbi:efflux RND transporter periplasmic adaptor subunit [Janthinobacterium sp. 17J80-10]|uniref:efflux RND transporter periplasmic adaptor subunit n=1 Tax=Janthinobacterium sp. 17J80-10 TaxID=2497863 RepID=UPI00100553B1|nr:efflux RND transporter periplasmic adaptor subunit [Janthinobacterium sp. 17J80-10]QAU34932.1 efflux RND transporter periplasmic adaptor subunit [Janthinobacterium sp. 17J80-10]